MKTMVLDQGYCGQYPPRPLSLKGIGMNLISRQELKKKLDSKENVKLIFVLGPWQYKAKHIPGSLNLSTANEALKGLDPNDEIVVYCSNEACHVSVSAYNLLVDQGFKNVRRYAGGLLDWEDAGFPLEGETVTWIRPHQMK